jgi:hypothetical protein
MTHSAAQASAQARTAQFGQSGIRSPDSAAVVRRARNLQANFERQRRQLLPRFYTDAPARCVIVGRFCHSDSDRSDEVVVPEEGSKIRRARTQLLLGLEEAAAALPGDDWIVGQRVRYHVEARDTSAVSIARACVATRWWCDALTGYALHAQGNFAGADSSFSLALDGMPPATRCHWINVAPLLDTDRREYRRMPCDRREALVTRIWWLADPLLMTPGNERRTEHFSRVMHTTLLQKDALSTFGISWGGDLAELTVRFGWPEKWTQQPSRSSYPGTRPSVTGHEREPAFHFFPVRWPPDSVHGVADSLWKIDENEPREMYAPPYARTFAPLDAQLARFRRGDSTLLVAAYDVSDDTLFRQRQFTAGLVAMRDEATPPTLTAVAEAPVRHVMTLSTPWKSQLIGVELLASDSAAAARWRSGFREIPFEPDKISVSDLLFVDGTVLPDDLTNAIPRAHGGTVFRRDAKVGLFWEIYGTAPADSTLPISLTISPVETGRLRAALGVLRMAPKPTPLNIRWQENAAAGLLSARAVMLDLSLVPPGKYEVKLEVGATTAATTSKVIRVR